jgi:hypothetical protein
MAEADLIDAIDSAAARLLEMGGFGVKNPLRAEDGIVKATLPEQVKAFEAVVEWAKTRRDLRPPEKAKAKFDGIRSGFNSSSRKRRGSRAPAEAEAEPGSPEPESAADAGTAPDEPAPGADIFGA